MQKPKESRKTATNFHFRYSFSLPDYKMTDKMRCIMRRMRAKNKTMRKKNVKIDVTSHP